MHPEALGAAELTARLAAERAEHMFDTITHMDLAAWEVEQLRRSIAMLPPECPAALDRERALELLDQLERALLVIERGPAGGERPVRG